MEYYEMIKEYTYEQLVYESVIIKRQKQNLYIQEKELEKEFERRLEERNSKK